MASVIEHIPDYIVAVNEVHRVLKPRGIFGMTTDYTHDQKSIVSHKSGRTLTQNDIEAMVKVIEGCGFKSFNKVDFKEVDLRNPENRAVKGEYTFISLFFRKK